MHKDATSAIQAFLDESIAGRKVLNDIDMLIIVDINNKMLISLEQSRIKWQSQNG